MNYYKLFWEFWSNFQNHQLCEQMKQTVENSPYHREANVFVHTQMVLEEYNQIWRGVPDYENSKEYMLGALAAAFHDVGKPEAEEVCESAERGVYRRYAGHEHVSAVEWLLFATDPDNRAVMSNLYLTAGEVYKVAWMVEYHLPYGIKDKKKQQALVNTIGRRTLRQVFYSLLRADCRGRISDDHPTKLQKVEDWIAENAKIEWVPNHSNPDKRAIVLIGTSSSGKSTSRKNFIEQTVAFGGTAKVYSLDDTRLSTFVHPTSTDPLEMYKYAFEQSCEQKDVFKKAANDALNAAFEGEPNTVISDNTNLSKKARAEFIARARQKGYAVHCSVKLTHPKTATEWQAGREDREGVPIYRQYRQLVVPSMFTEADTLHIT